MEDIWGGKPNKLKKNLSSIFSVNFEKHQFSDIYDSYQASFYTENHTESVTNDAHDECILIVP